MRKKWMTMLLAVAMLTGCGGAKEVPEQEAEKVQEVEKVQEEQEVQSVQKEQKVQEVQDVQEVQGEQKEQEVQSGPYAEQIGAYRTALTEQWDQWTYLEQDMSGLAVYYYGADELKKVGYALMDLNMDGIDELVIGAGNEKDPVIFELWTMNTNGNAVKVLTSQERNRYYLEWHDEGVYMLEHQGSNNAANFVHCYYTLLGSRLLLQQGIVFDAMADEDNPWFVTYDEDWDTSNDRAIDEELALDIINAYSQKNIVPKYTPFV